MEGNIYHLANRVNISGCNVISHYEINTINWESTCTSSSLILHPQGAGWGQSHRPGGAPGVGSVPVRSLVGGGGDGGQSSPMVFQGSLREQGGLGAGGFGKP